MEKWEIALKKFLKNWESKKEVVGAIVCGSFVTGNPSDHSDIDLHLILNKKTKWRERGNVIIDGILIEYFANPARRHYEYSKEDYQSRRKINAHMFSTGRVLFDKTGELKQLVNEAKKDMIRKYPKVDKTAIELSKYAIWDMRDNLEEIYDAKGDEFEFVYHVQLNGLFDKYSKFVRFDSIPANKLKRFLANEKDQKKYHIAKFPDQEFVKLFVEAITLRDYSQMIKKYEQLTNHILKKMGGFNIDGWKIRTPS